MKILKFGTGDMGRYCCVVAAIKVLGIVALFLSIAYGQPHDSSLCPYLGYQKAFVGVLEKKFAAKKRGAREVLTFAVTQPIKAMAGEKKIPVLSSNSTRDLRKGKTYLIFLRYDSSEKKFEALGGFPTIFIPSEVAQERERSENSPETFQNAFGQIPAANLKDLKNFVVTMRARGVDYKPEFATGGTFTAVFPSGTNVTGRIEVPFEAEVTVPNASIDDSRIERGKTIVAYTLSEPNSACQYHEFRFYAR